MPYPIVASLFAGALLFGLLYLINQKYKFDLVIGVYGIAIVILGSFIMMTISDVPNSIAPLGYLVTVVLSVFALLGYILTWVLVKRVFKK